MKLRKSHELWILFRIVVIIFFASSPFTEQWENLRSKLVSLDSGVLVFMICFFLPSGYFGMKWILKQSIKKREKKKQPLIFYRPNWKLNPFLSDEPYLFMHVGCMAFLATSLTGFSKYYASTQESSSSELIMYYFLLIVSVSWLLSIYFNIALNKDKFEKKGAELGR